MTLFIQEKLGLDEKKAKELQTNYFYKYNTSLNGLMLHHNVIGDEFLKYVHDINLDFLKLQRFMIMRFITIRVKDDDNGYLLYVNMLKIISNVSSF